MKILFSKQGEFHPAIVKMMRDAQETRWVRFPPLTPQPLLGTAFLKRRRHALKTPLIFVY